MRRQLDARYGIVPPAWGCCEGDAIAADEVFGAEAAGMGAGLT